MSEEKGADIFVPIEWGTHITCDKCGEKILRGIFNFVEHQSICTCQFTQDAEFEIIEPKQIENKSAIE